MAGDLRPPFQPGHPGNPTGGRPKKTDDMRAAEEHARKRSLASIKRLCDIAEQSADEHAAIKAAVAIRDFVFGKPAQAITGAEGEPLIPRVDLSRLSDEQLAAIVAVGRAIASGPSDGGGSGGASGEATEGVAPDSST